MNVPILTPSQAEVAIANLTPEQRAMFDRCFWRAETAIREHAGPRRGFGVAGTMAAVTLIIEGIDKVADDVLWEHRLRHRRHGSRSCSERCEARELFAYGLDVAEGLYPATGWPIRRLLADYVEVKTDYPIGDYLDLAHQIKRDLPRLRAALIVPSPRRTLADRRLVASFPVMSSILRKR